MDELNARRIELAEKKSRGQLAGDEATEFEKLQAEYFEYLYRKYPHSRPSPAYLEEVEARLRKEEGV